MIKTPTLPLSSGSDMPAFGLGTWRSEPGSVGTAIEYALTHPNYRHIDCAAIYGNEPEIGAAFQKVFSAGQVKREDVFITSKLWNTEHDPKNVEAACRKTLADLRLDYLDLYLIHWGIPFIHNGKNETVADGMVQTEPISIQQTWQALENLVEKGLVKSIGVANFTAPMILDLLSYAKIKPAVNQIEIHPYNTQLELVDYCQKNDIQVTAYSPLGSTGGEALKPLADKTIISLAKKHHKTPAQILIRWSLQRGLIVIPKSTKPERILENSQVFDFELLAKDMEQINQLNKNYRFVDPSDWWGCRILSNL